MQQCMIKTLNQLLQRPVIIGDGYYFTALLKAESLDLHTNKKKLGNGNKVVENLSHIKLNYFFSEKCLV